MGRWVKHGSWWHKEAAGFSWGLTRSGVSRQWSLYQSKIHPRGPGKGECLDWWSSPIPGKRVGKRYVTDKRRDSRKWSVARAKRWAATKMVKPGGHANIDKYDLEERLDRLGPRRAARFLQRIGATRHALGRTVVWKLADNRPARSGLERLSAAVRGEDVDGVIITLALGDSARVESVQDFVDSVDVEELFPEAEDQFNDDFWSAPVPLYHNTDPQKAKSIDDAGLLPMSETRGITNRGTGAAVFTTSSEDEAVGGVYGDALYTIDTVAMKRDGYTPFVAEEGPYREYELTRRLGHILDVEIEPDIEQGISPYTVVVFGAIPPEYLSREWLGSHRSLA